MMREFELIRSIIAHNGLLPDTVTIPPGDDMAAIALGDTELLVAVDQVIEEVHFDRKSATLEQIGRKAITRNLSDVAAMAAKPLATLVSVILPKHMAKGEAEQLLAAVRQSAQAYNAPLIGGDTATHEGPLMLSVTVLAIADGIEPVKRDGAQVGDAIYVTGQLGGSLHAYEGKVHHLDFEPRVTLARTLAAIPTTRPNAMIDLSDGLARDLPHLTKGAEINARLLPVSPVARQYALLDNRPGWLNAVADGEDYELLFTVPHDAPIPKQIEGVPITHIGQITNSNHIVLIDGDENINLEGLGWEHNG
jgi:thiamine-monophosphate kinase